MSEATWRQIELLAMANPLYDELVGKAHATPPAADSQTLRGVAARKASRRRTAPR